jgi:hypothetical protein
MKPSEKIAILFDKFSYEKQVEILDFLFYLLEKEMQQGNENFPITPLRNPDPMDGFFRQYNA